MMASQAIYPKDKTNVIGIFPSPIGKTKKIECRTSNNTERPNKVIKLDLNICFVLTETNLRLKPGMIFRYL
jgi:hypothetical protein